MDPCGPHRPVSKVSGINKLLFIALPLFNRVTATASYLPYSSWPHFYPSSWAFKLKYRYIQLLQEINKQ